MTMGLGICLIGTMVVSGKEKGNTDECDGSTPKAQFVVDAGAEKKSVLIDYTVWEALLTLLEDLENIEEIRHLRNAGEEVISWEQAKSNCE